MIQANRSIGDEERGVRLSIKQNHQVTSNRRLRSPRDTNVEALEPHSERAPEGEWLCVGCKESGQGRM
ncbi:hypothetical protein B0O99DRAFT_639395 [Bisporella sp. PMI_857]|nr:hypothetical protein B0O99DRAFT_639395 [Bisporella sp. PMI_857]